MKRLMFWNNEKQHGIKTKRVRMLTEVQFWNNEKQHGIKTIASDFK